MSQNYIAQPSPPNHTLGLKHLRILADLLARERGAELAAASAVTSEGERIDLLHTARCTTGAMA